MITVHKRTAHRLLAGVAVGVTAAAVTIHAIPAHADVLFVPGTGGTKPHAAADVDLSWLDGGRYGSQPAECLCDSALYPARLGPGEGDKSLAVGQESFVQYLLAHPEVDQVAGGSQGSMVVYRALSDPRLAGRRLSVRLYSNPDTPGTGVTARFPREDIPTTGLTGGTPVQPTDPNVDITSISHEWDPVAYFPKYAWTYAFTLPAAVAGFLAYHGALGGPYGAMAIDYDGATVTKDGNLTVIKLRDPFTPYGQLAVIAATMVAGPQAGHVVGTLIKPLDDIAAGVLKFGGQDVPGAATFAPTPQVAAKQVQGLVDSFGKAAKDFAAIPQRLAAGPVKSPKPTAVPAIKPTLVPVTATKPKPRKPSANPIHDTIKTVQGALKQFTPKPKAKQQKSEGEK
ncbi:PE-PPE domain-containing protein [Mycolicibacterium llatzerense]|uniref:PE-PPE domain-containing protein n=1 Tax=Mycolicibacterium llatzerense TaxID=280871 RepID=UPI0021B5093D|nr:PE-PPE domain-containing protein [Mycolicibacterium llatzerense]